MSAGLLERLGRWLAPRPDIDATLEALHRSALAKGWQTELPQGPPIHPLRSLQLDPFSLVAAMGYKDRRFSLSYDVLKRISRQLTVIAAILQRRTSQVAAFSAPYRLTKSLGYEIKHKDPEHQTTRSEKLFIKQLERFVAVCGQPDAIREITSSTWDDFDTFLRKFVRDSLVFDQACMELIPDRAGRPCAFMAVDASTIRLAVTEEDLLEAGSGAGTVALETTRRVLANPLAGPYGRGRQIPPPDRVDYVQVFQGQIVNLYAKEELAFCIRNPRTDLYANGYGFSELEQLVLTVTSILWAEEYNRNFFRNGSIPKGILNFKSDTPDPESLEAFKTYWTAQMTGVQNAWRLPMFQSEGLDYINLQLNNRDMEFTQWVEYQLKLATALYGMDPSEINFDISRASSGQPLFESPSEGRISDSKENGLRPLLRFIARMINRHVIDAIDDHFYFDFVGLDELSEPEKMQMRTQEITTYKTIDEVRAEADLPALPDGSGAIVLNPVWAQFAQMRLQAAQQAQAGQPPPSGEPATGDGEPPAATAGSRDPAKGNASPGEPAAPAPIPRNL
jgi:hypothetical protein